VPHLVRRVALLFLMAAALGCAARRGLVHRAFFPESDPDVRSAVEVVTPAITPPVKTTDLRPRMPPRFRGARRVAATVLLDAVITAEGVVKPVRVFRADGEASTDEAFAEECIAASTQWRFRPATRDGAPLAVWTKVACTFHTL
jgi:TonB-like protein